MLVSSPGRPLRLLSRPASGAFRRALHASRPPLLTRAAAVGVALATLSVAAACGSGGGDDNTGGSASGGKFDPATCQGGTLSVLNQKDITHLDPARLYTSGGGNIPSLLFRTLTTRNRAGGAEGAKVVPDLATNTGRASEDARPGRTRCGTT